MSRKDKADVFISYARKTGRVMAGRMKSELKNLNYKVHIDTHDGKNGENTKREKEEVIRKCKDVILILSANIVDDKGNEQPIFERKWVARELCYAIKYKKNIVVIKMDDFHFLKDENGNNKDLQPPREIVEEFDENVISKLRDLPHTNLMTGIDFREETSDYALKTLRSKLKSKPRWRLKKKIAIWGTVFVLSAILAIISKMIYNTYMPVFSLNVLAEDNNPSGDEHGWNFQYILSNKGGELSSGKVIPKLHLSMEIVSQLQGYDYKFGFYNVECTGFYDPAYLFNNLNNTVTIFETDADRIVDYIERIEKKIEEKDLRIHRYAVQTFFEIHYKDCFGINHKEYYSCENNYNYYDTCWINGWDEYDGLIRAFTDNELISIYGFDDLDVLEEIPLQEDLISYNAKSTAKYIMKHKNSILKSNIVDTTDAEDETGNEIDAVVYQYGDFAYDKDLDEDKNGMLRQWHLRHQNCTREDNNTVLEKIKSFLKDIFH